MPTYSYRCTVCDTAFDIRQEFTDDSLTVCPNCGGKLRKLFSAVGVTFTGSGFYRNDSRPAQKSEKSESSGGSDGASKSESSSPAPASTPSTPSTSSSSTPKKTGTNKE